MAKNGHIWGKAQHAKYAATLKRKAQAKAKTGAPTPPLTAHYVDQVDSTRPQQTQAQQAAIDIGRIEDRAFRRGLFTAFQMVMDIMIRELR